jgi:hypothetical protein
MKNASRVWIVALAVLFACSGPALAQSGFLWDGSHWKDLTPELKIAYIKGVGNLADFEVAAGGGGRTPCISQAFVDELKTMTVSQIVQEVDNYYAENPDRLNASVIEVVLRRCTASCPPETEGGATPK